MPCRMLPPTKLFHHHRMPRHCSRGDSTDQPVASRCFQRPTPAYRSRAALYFVQHTGQDSEGTHATSVPMAKQPMRPFHADLLPTCRRSAATVHDVTTDKEQRKLTSCASSSARHGSKRAMHATEAALPPRPRQANMFADDLRHAFRPHLRRGERGGPDTSRHAASALSTRSDGSLRPESARWSAAVTRFSA